ncbi:TPA: hypothetical protein ACH3X3_013631 [Trebouxia sp. C0006]
MEGSIGGSVLGGEECNRVKNWHFTTWVALFPLARTATVPGRHSIVLCMISQYAVKLAKQSIQLAGWPDVKQYSARLRLVQLTWQQSELPEDTTNCVCTGNVSLNMLFTQGKFLQDSKLVVQILRLFKQVAYAEDVKLPANLSI